MRRFGQSGPGIALIALAASSAQACTARREPPAIAPRPTAHLFVAQAETGFIIREEASDTSEAASLPVSPVTLGDNVRFDRRALIPSSSKDIPHGETR